MGLEGRSREFPTAVARRGACFEALPCRAPQHKEGRGGIIPNQSLKEGLPLPRDPGPQDGDVVGAQGHEIGAVAGLDPPERIA